MINIEGLDEEIRDLVELFNNDNISTFESCQGGEGHAFSEPTIRFHGLYAEGFLAYALAIYNGYKVKYLRRYYTVSDGELVGPEWEIVFTTLKSQNV
jgi:hypothetical protein